MAENQTPLTEEEIKAQEAADAQAKADEEKAAEEAKAAAAAKKKEEADAKKASTKKAKVYYSPTSGVELEQRPDGLYVDPKTNETFAEAYLKEVANDEIACAQVNVNPKTSNEALVNPQPVSNFAGAPNGDNSGKVFEG